MKSIVWFLLLILTTFIQAVWTSTPLVLLILLIWYIRRPSLFVYIGALISGFILDTLLIQTLGGASLYFILFLFFLSLYKNKFEITTPLFVFLYSFIGSMMYLIFFQGTSILIQALSVGVATTLFYIARVSIIPYKRHKIFDMDDGL